jgi:hypothetical protein
MLCGFAACHALVVVLMGCVLLQQDPPVGPNIDGAWLQQELLRQAAAVGSGVQCAAHHRSHGFWQRQHLAQHVQHVLHRKTGASRVYEVSAKA